jgi:predicted nucleic acid-binding protein
MDILLAGIVRESKGTVITRDQDFGKVEGLDVESYIDENGNDT